ncbi:hypothetical protein B9Z55_004258 [Caenorhabditis nigoni]|uniref:UBX domain-containing protein n=1 Tax=Caenorhabditis nigoni TaxID=1611254 RepID=A0A2G5UVH6_9PELO|nr:hypothetical protein B9Z55_004258 [Caenorhabditis nigoni]
MANNNEKIAQDRAILSQQNKEYAESLAKDLAKMKEKEKCRVAAEKKEKRKKMIEEYRGKVKDTKSTSGSHRVLVRYPSGIRVILCFSPSESLKNLFDSIISNPACPNFFKLRSVHPKAEIQCFPEWYQNLCHEELEEEDVTASESKESVNSTHTAIGFQPLGRMDTIPNNSILFVTSI